MTTQSNVEQRVIAVLDGFGITYEIIHIDPDLADTAAFCEAYGYDIETCGNTIVVASKRPAGQYSACVVKGSDRLDVNKTVRGLMGVRRASFATAEQTAALTGMEIGGVTPFALPPEVPVYADRKLMELDHVILGSGSRSSKLRVPPSVFEMSTDIEVLEGLSMAPRV